MNSFRTCIICRKKFSKNDLISFSIKNGEAGIIVFTKNRQGRGFHICENSTCLDTFLRINAGPVKDRLEGTFDRNKFIESSVSSLRMKLDELKKVGSANTGSISMIEKRLSIFHKICEGRRMP